MTQINNISQQEFAQLCRFNQWSKALIKVKFYYLVDIGWNTKFFKNNVHLNYKWEPSVFVTIVLHN